MLKASLKFSLCVLILFSRLLFASDTLIVGEISGQHFSAKISHISPKPLSINTFHRWQIELRNVSGDIVENATIQLTGGMPTHNHGLPTNPKVTQYLGQGRYLLEGVKFHMQGDWQLDLVILANGKEDKLLLNIQL